MPWKPPPEPICSEALELLRKEGRRSILAVQKLLGWESSSGMPGRLLAETLGVTRGQLRYLLYGKAILAQQKATRRDQSAATKVDLIRHTSRILRFSIALPDGWHVTCDSSETHPLAHEWFEHQRKVGASEWEMDAAERHARLEEMQVGLFQASPPNNADGVEIEISKLRLDDSLTAIQLYELGKSAPTAVPWGARPSKGISVDGLRGVLYYYMLDTGEALAEQPVFYNVYLAEGTEGWLISCSCRFGQGREPFDRYKPIFRRTVESFRRIRAI